MICSICGGRVIWRGPWSNLTHTECENCGAHNSQIYDGQGNDEGDEEGEICRRVTDDHPVPCFGRLILKPADDSNGCSCHLSAPCGHCMSIVPQCTECDWRGEEP